MSLILEALKKLERDRETPDRGILVLAPPAWSARPTGWWLRGVGLGVTAAIGAAIAVVFLRPHEPRAAAAPAPASVRSAAPVTPADRAAATSLLRSSGPTTNRNAPVALPLQARAPFPQPPPPRRAESAPSRAPAAEPAVEGESTAAPPEAPEPATAATEEPAKETTIGAGLQLQAISEQGGVPVAVVNGKLVRAGETVDGVRIVRIGAAEVEIESAGRRRVLRF